MINMTDFSPIPVFNPFNLDDVVVSDDDDDKSYTDRYIDAYDRLRDMYAYNYDQLIDTDYDELHKIHYYEWLHKFDSSS